MASRPVKPQEGAGDHLGEGRRGETQLAIESLGGIEAAAPLDDNGAMGWRSGGASVAAGAASVSTTAAGLSGDGAIGFIASRLLSGRRRREPSDASRAPRRPARLDGAGLAMEKFFRAR